MKWEVKKILGGLNMPGVMVSGARGREQFLNWNVPIRQKGLKRSVLWGFSLMCKYQFGRI